MKAILMVAGVGSRISQYIDQKAKCMVDIGGCSLIRNTVSMLIENDIKVSVVTGYRKNDVVEELRGLDVDFYFNPFYESTNSICSLWFAREQIDEDDLIIANGDVYWGPDVLREVLLENRDVAMLADSTRGIEGDYLFKYDHDKLIKFGKGLPAEDISGEYVGISRIGTTFQKAFLEKMDALIWQKKHNLWWEDILYSFIPERDIYVHDIAGKFWAEVDVIEDYRRILEYRKAHNLNGSVLMPAAFAGKVM